MTPDFFALPPAEEAKQAEEAVEASEEGNALGGPRTSRHAFITTSYGDMHWTAPAGLWPRESPAPPILAATLPCSTMRPF